MYNNRNVRRPLSIFLMVLLIFSGGILFPTDRNIANAEPVATDNSAESAAAQDTADQEAVSPEQQDTDAKDTEAAQGENETSETAQDKEESSETAQDEAVTGAEDEATSEDAAPAEEVQAPKKAKAAPRKAASLSGGELTLNGNDTYELSNDTSLTKIIVNGEGNILKGPEGNPVNLNGCSENNGIVINTGAELTLENVKLNGAWFYNSGKLTANNIDANNCVFKNNSGSTLEIKDSKLHDSYRWTGPNSQGIHETMIHGTNSTITITNTEITDNKNDSTQEQGSIISVLNGSKLTLDSVTGNNNTAKTWGGLVYSNNSDITIKDSTFDGNTASNNGGGVVCQVGGKLDITKSEFKNNLSSGQFSAGGAIYKNGGELTIDDDSTFSNNYVGRHYYYAANDDLSYGGAIYLTKVDATIGASTFKENGCALDWSHVTRNGGAIYAAESEVTLNGTIFTENYTWNGANAGGGAVFFTGNKAGVTDKTQATAHLYVNGAKFTENGTTTYGGALTVRDGAYAKILDLKGDPTEFKKNYVEWGTYFSGGALFIDQAYVEMEDAAIYNNYADDAGGGIAACSTGTTEARSLNGAAIFNNTVAKNNDSAVTDAKTHQDIYFQTLTHKDASGGNLDLKNFPEFKYELYERMFNGGLHMWESKTVSTTNSDNATLNSLVAQSNPTNTDTSGAKVIFTENAAYRYNNDGVVLQASGGAIGCNGLLEIGTSTEIKLLKVWDDNHNANKNRPSLKEYKDLIKAGKLKVEGPDGSVVDLTAANILVDVVEIEGAASDSSNYTITYEDGTTTEVPASEFSLSGNITSKSADDNRLREAIRNENLDAYLIIISGLKDPGEYKVKSDEVTGYSSDVDIFKSEVTDNGNKVEYKRIIANMETTTFEKVWKDRETAGTATIVVSWMPDYEAIAKSIRSSYKGIGVDEINIQSNFKPIEKVDKDNGRQYVIDKLSEAYKTVANGRDLKEDLEAALSGEFEDYILSILGNTIDTPEGATLKANEDGSIHLEITLAKSSDWKKTIQGIKIPADAKIEEKSVDSSVMLGYSRDKNAYTITNSELIDISVEKAWEDNDNQDGKRPESITVNLLADGEVAKDAEGNDVEPLVIKEADEWKGEFKNLPKYKAVTDKDGNVTFEEIVYTIEEDEIEGYTATITQPASPSESQAGTSDEELDNDKIEELDQPTIGEMKPGFIAYEPVVLEAKITNTYKTKKIEIPVSKVWEDQDDVAGLRPAEITVDLKSKDGVVVDSINLNASNKWKGSFTDIEEGEYTVEEKTVEYYDEPVITGDIKSGFTVTNKLELLTDEDTKGSKTWVDGGNEYGDRPESITVKLLADGKEVNEVEVTADDDWTYSFGNLPKYLDGKEIEYTVQEVPVDNYTATVNGLDVVNTWSGRKPETKDNWRFIKTWDDDEDAEGKRPESVNIRLYVNNEEVDKITLSEDNEWSGEFENMRTYDEDGEEIVYSFSEDTVDGYKLAEVKYNSEEEATEIVNEYTGGHPKKTGAATGDSNDMMSLLGLMALSAVALAAFAVRRRREQ